MLFIILHNNIRRQAYADGTSYEGIGLPPDVVVQNDSADVANGRDEALEKAISILKNWNVGK